MSCKLLAISGKLRAAFLCSIKKFSADQIRHLKISHHKILRRQLNQTSRNQTSQNSPAPAKSDIQKSEISKFSSLPLPP